MSVRRSAALRIRSLSSPGSCLSTEPTTTTLVQQPTSPRALLATSGSDAQIHTPRHTLSTLRQSFISSRRHSPHALLRFNNAHIHTLRQQPQVRLATSIAPSRLVFHNDTPRAVSPSTTSCSNPQIAHLRHPQDRHHHYLSPRLQTATHQEPPSSDTAKRTPVSPPPHPSRAQALTTATSRYSTPAVFTATTPNSREADALHACAADGDLAALAVRDRACCRDSATATSLTTLSFTSDAK